MTRGPVRRWPLKRMMDSCCRITGESSYTAPQELQLTPYQAPAVWQKYFDDATQSAYFYNTVTGHSTYDRPGDYDSPRALEAQGTTYQVKEGTSFRHNN
jgi:hypothetical protein